MITEVSNFISQHHAASTIAAMNAVHFAHLAWPKLVAMFPYCRDHGGALGIAKTFFVGTGGSGRITPTISEPPKPIDPPKT